VVCVFTAVAATMASAVIAPNDITSLKKNKTGLEKDNFTFNVVLS